jgi:thymidylate synthase
MVELGPSPVTPPAREPPAAAETAAKRRRRGDDSGVGRPPSWDDLYRDLGHKILKFGEWQRNRKGGNIGIFGDSFEIDVSTHLPLLTLRSMPVKSLLKELQWYLRGEDHVRWLREQGNKFWDADANEDGWVGYNYGLLSHWPSREGGHVNQLGRILKKIQAGGASRTWCITLLKPDEQTKLESCIVGLQLFCRGERLDMKVDQRSCDFSLGLPSDVFEMAVLLHLVCQSSAGKGRAKNLTPGRLIWTFGHLHIYDNNLEKTEKMLERLPKPLRPQLQICSDAPLLPALFEPECGLQKRDLWVEFQIVDYDPHDKIAFTLNGRPPRENDNSARRPGTASTDQKPDNE